jgi:hypothetical protein
MGNETDRSPGWLKPDVRPARIVEQPDPITKQDRRDVHQHLVEQARIKDFPGCARAEDRDVLVPGRFLGDFHGVRYVPPTNVKPGAALPGPSRVNTNCGPCHAPP